MIYRTMARDVGIEPTLRGLESLVLPLDQSHRVTGYPVASYTGHLKGGGRYQKDTQLGSTLVYVHAVQLRSIIVAHKITPVKSINSGSVLSFRRLPISYALRLP